MVLIHREAYIQYKKQISPASKWILLLLWRRALGQGHINKIHGKLTWKTNLLHYLCTFLPPCVVVYELTLLAIITHVITSLQTTQL